MIDFNTLDDDDLNRLIADAYQEQVRRRVIAEAPARADHAAREYLTASGRDSGEPWVAPSGAHDAFPAGWIVEHNGKTWESLISANVWEPGVSGWREVVEEDGAPAEWVQPSGAHDAYGIDDLVTFEGQVYRSTVDGNVWSPADNPAGWELVPPPGA